MSSHHDIEVSENYCFTAEIGLSGEIRPVPKVEHRIQEAAKLGYEAIIISKFSKIGKPNDTIKVIPISKIEDLVTYLFG